MSTKVIAGDGSHGPSTLTADERHLLEVWRDTDEQGRRALKAVADSLAEWRRAERLRIVK